MHANLPSIRQQRRFDCHNAARHGPGSTQYMLAAAIAA